ncbi:TIGR04338 family metallohydrolase [Gordonia soli]|uniref:TIGR04338 family metallohydrolase n=1 Tax=Gordonia soli NBRC 108243 TaxID=1223545 RepID=M0QHL5_9ACTN|nr:TIGR04338 family metallohydrolase [Gordonia soli]GAC67924.1 hypothetical protein GS4_11_01930 [Gordonia soli NBRC 108243]
MSPRDTHRAKLYEAERMVLSLVDRASSAAHTVQLAGTELTLPVEARFASLESVDAYVHRVLAMPTVQASSPRAAMPVRVRERRGDRSAHYSRSAAGGEIAVPTSVDGRWALRELVILHEIAHHLDDSGDAAHGAAFAHRLIDLVGAVLGPEMQFVYRVIFGDSDVI